MEEKGTDKQLTDSGDLAYIAFPTHWPKWAQFLGGFTAILTVLHLVGAF